MRKSAVDVTSAKIGAKQRTREGDGTLAAMKWKWKRSAARRLFFVRGSVKLALIGLAAVVSLPLSGAVAAGGPVAGKAAVAKSAMEAPAQETPDLPAAQAQARQSSKALLLAFGAKWCGPCQVFDRQVLPTASVQSALKEVVFVHYDADTPSGKDAARTLGVIGYPTFIALGYDGRELSRLQGYQEGDDFVRWVRGAAADAEPTASLQARAETATAPAEPLFQLGRRRLKGGDEAAAEQFFMRAQQSATAAGTTSAIAIAAEIDWELQLLRLRRLLREEPRKAMVLHLSRFPASASADAAVAALSRLGPADAATRQALGRYVDAHAEASQQDQLNNAVYSCLKVGALDEAERGARRLVKLDGRNPGYLDTLAEVMHLRGDRTAALRYSRDALTALGKAAGMSAKEQQQTRTLLLRNQLRFERAQHDLPPELQGPDDALQPWEH